MTTNAIFGSVAVGATLLLCAPAMGQSIGAISLGQSEDAAVAILGVKSVKISGSSKSMAFNDTTSAFFCDHVVVEIQGKVGSTFHDFAATVVANTATWGAGVFEVHNARTSAGEMSWQNVTWPHRGYNDRVGLLFNSSGRTQVTRSVLGPDKCQ